MPSYDFRCPAGHVTTLTQSMHVPLPQDLTCQHGKRETHTNDPSEQGRLDGACLQRAARVFWAPAAIHFKGRGFYATDVKGAQERRRRPNPGDDLPRQHDPVADALARSL